MQAVTLAITNYNRTDLLLESFKHVWEDDRIDEILIVDDDSDLPVEEFLIDKLTNKPKINLFINEPNIGMGANKLKAVSMAKNDWVILFDSDNVLTKQYLDAIFRVKTWDKDTIYNPSFARPHFNFTHFSEHTIDRRNVRRYVKQRNFDSLINVCNYFVNRESYIDSYTLDSSIKGTDTSFFFYNWLAQGKRMHVVKGMEYEHRVHDGSEFLKDLDYNMQKGEEIKKMIAGL